MPQTETDTRTLFDPVLVADLISKVQGRSSLAALCASSPLPFNGTREFTFAMDREVDIVAENDKKTEGGITVAPVTIIPIKFEYGARVSDEFMYATDENRLAVLQAFNDGFANKLAKGIDLAAMHGINPRSGEASTVVGDNYFDGKVTSLIEYNSEAPDDNLEDAVLGLNEYDCTGIMMSKTMAADMAKVKANNVKQYPEFGFGAKEASLNGIPVSINSTVSNGDVDNAIVGNFADGFKWGFAKEIPLEVIQYGDPDNSGSDLKGHNQVYLRAEAYIGWGILLPDAFVRVAAEKKAESGEGN